MNEIYRRNCQKWHKHPANHEIAGFMPYRREFETEFDNDAEALVKDMCFLEEDYPRM